MTRSRLIRTLGAFLTLAPLPTHAEDYPFSGLFWPAVDSVDTTRIAQLCALMFLDQRPDGTWSAYHVDLAAFREDQIISYHKMSEGTCSYTPETKVETCLVTMDLSFPEAVGNPVYDVLTAVQDDRVDTVMIEAASLWETVMQTGGTGDEGMQLTYLRCPYQQDAITALISPDITTLSADDLNALRFPDPDLLSSPEVAQLVQMLGGQ